MKKLSVLLLSGVVLALVGCGNQGGSGDQYNTETGTTSNTNFGRRSVTNDYQGTDSLRPVRSNPGDIYSTNNTDWSTTNQNQPIDPERTNNLPEY